MSVIVMFGLVGVAGRQDIESSASRYRRWIVRLTASEDKAGTKETVGGRKASDVQKVEWIRTALVKVYAKAKRNRPRQDMS